MVFGFSVILPLKNYFFDKSISKKHLFIFPIISLSIGLLFWYVLGLIGFEKNTGVSNAGTYGENTFNLNSFFNSYTYYSNFFPGLDKVSDGQHEGFSYLGLGMIIIVITAIFYFIYLAIRKRLLRKTKYLIPILLLTFLLLLFSISNTVTLGNKILFKFPIPDFLDKLGGIFRGSGRFCWPFYYLLTIFSMVIFSKLPFNKLLKTSFFVVLLSLQLYDIEHILTSRNLKYGSYSTKLNDEKWISIFKEFDQVVTYPPFQNTMLYNQDYQDLMFLANKANTNITIGYVARSKPTNSYLESLNTAILKGDFSSEKETLYVTTSKFIENFSIPIFKDKVAIKTLDDFIFIYPKDKDLELFFSGKENNKYLDSLTFNIKKNIEKKSKQFIKVNNSILENKEEVKIGIDELTIVDEIVKIRGWAFNFSVNTNVNDSVFVSFSNKTETYLFNTKLISRPDVTSYFNRENLDFCGFNSLLYLNKLPSDKYQIGFVIKNKKITAHSKTESYIDK